ncbi:hypothetical protein TIFTF001_011998 [Ficus carica]|uniref:Pentatricopeptide repeat-containing protein n=1 Tax=Ficus carica TaxID=3494 RepID=A0AA87ZZC0_FICCA|nr:hypothetical protein TIFTF001_011998 [Ficus carica]
MTVRWPRILTPTNLSQIIRKQKNPLTALQFFNEAKSMYPSYLHNGPVYAAMIGVLGKFGRITEMKEVIDQMKNDSCECKDSVFVAAIKTYDKAGLPDEAFKLFKKIPQFNCVNWTESFNTILQIMVNESRFDDARRLFLENSSRWEVSSRIRSLNIFMHTLCEKGCSEVALQVFQEMDYQGIYPDRESYRILMRGLCQDGKLNEGIHLLYSMFWRISQKGSGEDVVIYRTLLDALCDNGKVEEAVEILGKILRKGLKAPKRCQIRIDLNQCSYVEDVESIKQLINEALVKGGIPSLASYSAMAIDLYNENKFVDGDKVLKEMQDRGFRPTHAVYGAKLAALCRKREVDEAVKVIEVEMVEANCVPTVKLYSIVVRGLCEGGKSTCAVGYLKKMAKQVGCVADEETYGVLVEGLCCEGKFLEASRVLEEMLVKSYWPCVETYNELIKGLCSVGRQFEAVMWLEEMISQGKLPEHSVWNSLVACVCHNMANFEICYKADNQLGSS